MKVRRGWRAADAAAIIGRAASGMSTTVRFSPRARPTSASAKGL
jgi:hypothetical protein